ncbi:MAG: calcium-binding protein, partial [Hyphomicrobium sp.]
TVDGGANNDRLIATVGDGDDTYIGGAGTDTYDLSGTTANATVNLATGFASSAQTGTDTLSGIENVVGSNGANTITGTANANTIEGRGGIDTINGGGGGDTLFGGAGADHISGGAGADIIVGGAGADTIDLGNPVDNNRDVVRLTDTGDYGDVVFDFRSTGNAGQRDVMSLSSALNSRFDDVNNNNQVQFASGNASPLLQIVSLDSVEAIYLGGANGQGVANANLESAADVAGAFNAEFTILSNGGNRDALFVINDTDANDFTVWEFRETGAQAGVQASELTLMAHFHSNSTVTTGQFIFEP